MTLAIVDLGCANLGSMRIAFERLGAEPVVTKDASTIASAGKVVLPGVGAAAFAMRRIDELGLAGTLRSLTRPVLGICLGMQILFEKSEEQDTTCLGILPGTVRKLEAKPGLPVPNMGWCKLETEEKAPGLRQGDYVYFANSYAYSDRPHTLATANHDGPFAAVVARDNFLGAQFHPERSGAVGARFLEAFLAA
jgi:glutamine amidotransferase